MAHDQRILKHEDQIEELRKKVPDWVMRLKRPPTPAVMPPFGPLEGIRVVSTGIIIAQPISAQSWRNSAPRLSMSNCRVETRSGIRLRS